MYLKAVELFGFKSFADKTVVNFNPGITCIVGPNGCGKSNVSDAVRWVLGERSAKLLRGSKMEDVIFAGTSLRKPVNMAEVSLVLDNRDQILSVGYDEVVITRRLYRSGESEYLINKTTCRYRDIQDLIMGTGIGSHSYSMIEQGRIDYILQADPDERRFLIEEAAGISRYKAQKDEAVRKLERTENNLLRLTDIVAEVERNIKYAERQAKRAEKYREHFDNLKQKEITRALIEEKNLAKKFEEIETNRTESISKEQQLIQKVETLKAAVLRLEKEEEEKLQELRFKESKRFEIKSEIQNRESSKEFNWEKIGEIKNQLETLEREIQVIEANKVSLTDSVERTESEFSELKARHETFNEGYVALVEKCRNFENQIKELESKESQYQDLAFEQASQIALVRNEIHQIEIKKTSFEISLKKNREAHEACEGERSSFQAKLAQLESNLDGKRASLETSRAEHENLKSELEGSEQKLVQLRADREIFLREYQELASRIEILQELQSSFFEKEGISAETRAKLESFDFVDSLYKELAIESGYEKIVEAVLGPFLKSLTVESIEDFNKLENQLTEESYSRLPVLIRSGHNQSQSHENIHEEAGIQLIPFARIVQPSPSVYRIISSLFANTFFVENDLSNEEFIEFQKKYPDVRLIHKSGKMWGPGPVIYLKGTKEDESFFLKHGEFEELQTNKATKEKEIAEADENLRLLQGQVGERRILVSEKLDSLRSIQFELEVDERDITELKASTEKKLQEHEFYCQEEGQLQSEIKNLEDGLGQNRSRLTDLENEEKQQKVNFSALQTELQEKRRGFDVVQTERTREETEKAAMDEKLKFAENNLVSFKNRITEEEEKRNRYQQLTVENNEKMVSIRSQNETIETELTKYRETLGREELDLRQIEEERLSIQEKKKSLTEELDREEKLHNEINARAHKLEMEAKEIDYLLTREKERLMQSYKIDLASCSITEEEIAQVNIDELVSEIEQLKDRVANAGTVNLLAVEEYEELKSRFEFLDAQKQDLEKARAELLEAIRKINRTTKRLFQETFEQVRTNFKEFFRILFNGGQAEMIILEQDNPLDSGIDIFVQPPGKKNQNISLLSGGEKALTAIALLFSLFKIKPSPFSVLDEIDAPLDEANIDRFLEVLKKFTENTQFIIVTHNRKTISMGSQLYGVTMQEAGVSKLVSVKLQEGPEAGPKGSVTEQSLSESITSSGGE